MLMDLYWVYRYWVATERWAACSFRTSRSALIGGHSLGRKNGVVSQQRQSRSSPSRQVGAGNGRSPHPRPFNNFCAS
ncbi:hypothetical protein PF003_g23456 [Phytophthora fragariae]|nr:hypothetical protein PF003_g23456 [Phytophthora fragariae]